VPGIRDNLNGFVRQFALALQRALPGRGVRGLIRIEHGLG